LQGKSTAGGNVGRETRASGRGLERVSVKAGKRRNYTGDGRWQLGGTE